MYLMYYTDDDGKRVYTLEVDSTATCLCCLTAAWASTRSNASPHLDHEHGLIA